MTPAAVDFLSSVTPQNPSPSFPFDFGAFSFPDQPQSSLRGGSGTTNSLNARNASEGGFSCGFSSPFVSRMSSEKPPFSGRSKPRLVKVRRQQEKSTSVSPQNDSGLNSFRSVSKNSNQLKNANSSTSNGFGASIGDVKFGKLDNAGFVFGANKSTLVSNSNNVGLVFDVNNSNWDSNSNSNSEHKEFSKDVAQSGANEFGQFENVGIGFGANKSSSVLNSNLGNRQCGESGGKSWADEFDKGVFVFGANKSSSISNSISDKRRTSGSVQQLGAGQFGEFNDVGFVFGADNSNSVSNKNSEQRASNGSMGQHNADEFRKSENGGSVFGANMSNFTLNSNLERRKYGESAVISEASEFAKLDSGKFGSKPATSASSSNFETREPSINGGIFIEGKGMMKEEKNKLHDKGKMELDFGKADNSGFVFGGNWSEPRSNLNSVKSESSENGGESVPVDSQKMKSGAQLGMFDNVGFVFGACPTGSSSISDSKKRESSESSGKLDFEDGGKMKVDIEVELHKAKANDGFMFGSSSKNNSSLCGNTTLSDEMNKANSENSGDYIGFVNTDVDKLGSDVNNSYRFVFGSSVNITNASGTSTVHKLSHEIRKLTVDCEKIGCSNNTKDPNINYCASSNNVFVFGSSEKSPGSCTGKSGTTSCDQFGNSNLQGPGNGSAVDKTEGIKVRTIDENIFVVSSSDAAACFFGGDAQHGMPNGNNKSTRSGLGVLAEQIKLDCPFGSFWEKEQPTNVNENGSDVHSVCMSTPKSFIFQAGLGKSNDGPGDQLNDDTKLNKTSNQSLFSSSGLEENKDKFSFLSTPVGVGTSGTGFRTPNGDASCSFTVNLYPRLNKKLEFGEKSRSIRDKRWKKARGKWRQDIPVQQQSRQNHVSEEGSQQKLESPRRYSPMDFSPYQDNNISPSTVNATSATHAKDEDLAAERGANISEGDKTFREPNEEISMKHYERFDADSSLEEGETECRNSKSEQVRIKSGDGVMGDGASSNMKREESECKKQFCFASSAEDIGERNFTFSASSAQESFPSTIRRDRKKYRMKVGRGPSTTPNKKFDTASSSVQFSPLDSSYLHLNQTQDKEGDVLNSQRKEENKSKGNEELDKQGSSVASQEACEKWRIRGNQAYANGHLSKAEEFYTKGINSVPHSETSGCCVESLVLCYSNRAAARMSRSRMREAIRDCMMAAALDPNFHKVQIRAANCHLALGEVEDALQHFTKCLESASDVCLDRRIIIEAANGQQNAQKVAECMNQCAELLQQRTSNAAISALEMISAVLSISPYSEKLLEMKGDALLVLRRYEEVIQLCEQTLVFAEKNFSMVAADNNLVNADDPKYNKSAIRIWRWRLMSKSYFHLGRLDVALELLEKQGILRSMADGCGSNTMESLFPFSVTIREILHRKNAGNEAFQSGRHTEAVEHYTAVVSSSIESRPFAAICFCNRAAAHQALGQIADAIADCSLAIALDGSYSKAVSRRATLHEMIKDYDQAASDLQRLISLFEKQSQEKVRQSSTSDEPTGSNVKELRQARHRLASVEENAKKGISLDHYLILGIKPSDTVSEIKKAYRKAALRHHPDKAGQFLARSESRDDGQLWKEIADEVHKDADRLFKMIGEAYAVLSDLTKRSQYDLQEELRNAQKESNGSRASRRPSDFYSSPYESSANRRYWQESWKTRNSRSEW